MVPRKGVGILRLLTPTQAGAHREEGAPDPAGGVIPPAVSRLGSVGGLRPSLAGSVVFLVPSRSRLNTSPRRLSIIVSSFSRSRRRPDATVSCALSMPEIRISMT